MKERTIFIIAIVLIFLAGFFYVWQFVDPIFIVPLLSPNDAAGNLIKMQVNALGNLNTSPTVTFAKGDSLNAKAIAEASGSLPWTQICLSKGEHSDTEGFELTDNSSNNRILRYTGSQLTVKLSVICDSSKKLTEDLTRDGLPIEWLNSCPQDIPNTEKVVCLLALRQV